MAKVVRELRSMVLALHSSKHLFSILQHLPSSTAARRLYLTKLTHYTLRQWAALAINLHRHPVPLASVVPHAPHYFAAVDASAHGMGGFWLPTTLTADSQPCVWRAPFPDSITNALVSTHKPAGTVTNSDLELAAAVLGHAILLSQVPPLPYLSTCMATDNTPTHAWISHGSTTSILAPAFLLSQLASDCQTRNAVLATVYTPGKSNSIADFLSLSFALSDDDVLSCLQIMAPIQPP
jgi:hypothetical protein